MLETSSEPFRAERDRKQTGSASVAAAVGAEDRALTEPSPTVASLQAALDRVQGREAAMLRAIETIGQSADVLAHEIKNPITAVNLALRAASADLGVDHRDVLADLVVRLERIHAMMRSTFSFVAPIEPKRRDFSVTAAFDAAVAGLQPEIARTAATVRVRVSPDVRLHADPALVQEMIAHLVENALEATPRGVTITLSAELAPDGSTVLAVEDDGPGLPERSAEALFEPFVTTKGKGCGLGLAVSRKIAEAHGGSLHAQRQRDRGARFEARLPARQGTA